MTAIALVARTLRHRLLGSLVVIALVAGLAGGVATGAVLTTGAGGAPCGVGASMNINTTAAAAPTAVHSSG